MPIPPPINRSAGDRGRPAPQSKRIGDNPLWDFLNLIFPLVSNVFIGSDSYQYELNVKMDLTVFERCQVLVLTGQENRPKIRVNADVSKRLWF